MHHQNTSIFTFTFCENFTFTFCHKWSRSVLTKLLKFKNVHPSGVSSSPCPNYMLPLPSTSCLVSSLLPKDVLPQTKLDGSVWVCPYCLRPALRGSKRTKVLSSLMLHTCSHSLTLNDGLNPPPLALSSRLAKSVEEAGEAGLQAF